MPTSPPVKYVRQADYTSFEAAHPTDTKSGPSLDADFGAVLISNNAIIDRLAQVQRADGALANLVVTPDSLSASTLALMAGTGVPRGGWLTTTAYIAKDIVSQAGLTYICVTAHAAGVFATDLAAGKWILFSAGLSPFTLDTVNNRVGLNMSPANLLDLAQNGTNTPAIAQIVNSQGGTAARADFRAYNGVSTLQLAMLSAGFTLAGVLRPGGALINADGPGGLTLNTSVNQPIYFGVNGAQVAAFTATLATIANRTTFGQAAEACSVSGAVAIGGTLSLGVTGGAAQGWPGLVIVSNTSQANANISTQTVYSVLSARANAATFAPLGTGNGSGGGAAFTIAPTGNGTITVTNTSGVTTFIEISFFGSLAS